MLSRIDKVKYGNLELCRDFNVTADPHVDSTSPVNHRLPSLRALFRKEDLYDAWRCLHDKEWDYTYFSARHNAYSRIDIFLVDKWLLQQISSSTISDIT